MTDCICRLDDLITNYVKPDFKTTSCLFKDIDGKKSQYNNIYKICLLFRTGFLKYLENKFGVKAIFVKKENPSMFFQSKSGTISIDLMVKLSVDDAFNLRINGDLKKAYKDTKNLIKDLPNYL